MESYNIAVKLLLSETASHPRKWIAEAISENLDFNNGEDLTDIEYYSEPDSFAQLADTVDDQVQRLLEERYTQVSAEEVGLDRRAGHRLYVSDEGIVVKVDYLRDLEYYGGFEYIKNVNIIRLGDYVCFTAEDSRVESCIDYYNSEK